MRRNNNRRGFTMAELLIVVAIITVLAGVSFIAVQNHQKSLAQLECDTVAKEIFFAAQNHLTMAESQGYLGENVAYGTPTDYALSDGTNAKDVYYFGVNGPGAFTGNSVLDLMLPFGSIDDTVRSAGNYVIRYQAKPGRVLDVWYGRASNQAYTGKYDADPTDSKEMSLADLIAHDYKGKVIGWYGGDEALEGGKVLNAPYIEVDNAERLTVTVDTSMVIPADAKDEDKVAEGNVYVKLLIKGMSSNAMAAITIMPYKTFRAPDDPVDGKYVVVLDDITTQFNKINNSGFHFAEIVNGAGPSGDKIDAQGTFYPGENITVQAVAFSNSEYASIAYSNEWTTNSLFADLVDGADAGVVGVGTGSNVAMIANMRHLANLDKSISDVSASNLKLAGARQTADLIWASPVNAGKGTTVVPTASDAVDEGPKAFTTVMGEDLSKDVRIYKKGETTGTDIGYWQPVNIDYPLVYDGMEPGVAAEEDGSTTENVMARCHSITGVKVSTSGADSAGLFGTVSANATIRNLELIDFDITAASGNAGALAGTLPGKDKDEKEAKVTVENVLAHNSADFDKLNVATVKSTSGAAGGLIGKMIGADVVKCAAALVVKSTGGNAGGLVGESNGGKIDYSYAGGHTFGAAYYKDGEAFYNVIAGGHAGGLVGNAGGTNIDYCYSTCSASGDTAGGLVGRTEGLLQNSYTTGLVNGNTAGAFAGYVLSTKQPVNCRYLEIINEITTGGAVSYLPPVPGWVPSDETDVPAGSVKLTGVSRADYSAASYADFSGAKADWKDAISYDGTLINLYNVESDSGEKQPKYNFNTVEQLGDVTVVAEADETNPADFVAIHYGDWPAPETLVVNEKEE